MAAAFAAATAEAYPARTITIIVPYAAGGPTDTLARILADAMRRSLARRPGRTGATRDGRLTGLAMRGV
jgi:tripartite-type tricarboxylate transporter receptor subunit TctC